MADLRRLVIRISTRMPARVRKRINVSSEKRSSLPRRSSAIRDRSVRSAAIGSGVGILQTDADAANLHHHCNAKDAKAGPAIASKTDNSKLYYGTGAAGGDLISYSFGGSAPSR